MNRFRLGVSATVLAVLLLVACGGGSDDDGGKVTTAAELGQAWPFSVDSGVVSCEGTNIALFTVDGTTYGLNSAALEQNYADSEPIRIDNPAIPGVRLDLGTIISLAIRQC